MRVVQLTGPLTSRLVNDAVPRASVDVSSAMGDVLALIADVETRGEAALLEIAERFDSVNPTPIRVAQSELKAALENLDFGLRESLEEAIARVRRVCEETKPEARSVKLAEGANVSLRWQPMDSVGLYVPGGKAVYPSSVVMNVVPAQVAGVPRLALASPAQAAFGGRPHPTVLAAAALLGVEEVYALGGPAAIAAMALGVDSIGLKPVNLITGPGNIYVAAAKRALKGIVGIDSEAGTTEILIVADESANARLIAYDLVSQAEHDEAAAAVLVTPSQQLIDEVQSEVRLIASQASNAKRVEIALAGQQSALVKVEDLASAVAFANHYATEHLEIHTRDPHAVAFQISNAGAIFLGSASPVSLGDYLAGSNHVLPTGGQAKHASGLGVHTFLRAQQVIDYDATALGQISEKIQTLAAAEGLDAHGDAIRARFE